MAISAHLPRHAVQPAIQRGFGQSCLRFSSGVEGPENDMIMVAINKTAWHPLGRRIGALGFEVHKTYSRGEVRLRSPDVTIPPEVKFNLLSDARDIARMTVGLRLCLDIFADTRMTPAMNEVFLSNGKIVKSLGQRNVRNWLRAEVMGWALEAGLIRRTLMGRSTLDVKALVRDPATLRQMVLQRADPRHHVSCTCRMGRPDDKGAVVDPDCRVIGVENLRVIDASIMPTLVRANTHIPVLMIAEKMAAQIHAASR